ncbi:hypothetical protein [Paenibacillus sp. FSL H3-0286]|uniref:hypothetical protein n=1 Tax=Paenibacillus sp. FSL H3-0286 TaxID=2921427 RepID=UPI003255419C
MDIIKHEKVDSNLAIFHLIDKVGRVWQTISKDEKEAFNNWAEGENSFTFIVHNNRPEILTNDYLIESLNIKRSAIVVIQMMKEILDTDAKREDFYAKTLGYNATSKIGCTLINRVLFQIKKTV